MNPDLIRKMLSSLRAVPALVYFALLAAIFLLFATEVLTIVAWSIMAVLLLNGLYHIVLAFRDFFGLILKGLVWPFAAIYRAILIIKNGPNQVPKA